MRNPAVVFEEDCAAGESGHQVNIREVRSNRHRQSGISSLPVESHLAQGHSGKGMCEVFHEGARDRKSTRLNSSHGYISYAVFCLKKKIKHYHKSNTRGILLTHRPYSFSHLLAH